MYYGLGLLSNRIMEGSDPTEWVIDQIELTDRTLEDTGHMQHEDQSLLSNPKLGKIDDRSQLKSNHRKEPLVEPESKLKLSTTQSKPNHRIVKRQRSQPRLNQPSVNANKSPKRLYGSINSKQQSRMRNPLQRLTFENENEKHQCFHKVLVRVRDSIKKQQQLQNRLCITGFQSMMRTNKIRNSHHHNPLKGPKDQGVEVKMNSLFSSVGNLVSKRHKRLNLPDHRITRIIQNDCLI